MTHAYRKNTWINTLNWVAMAIAVKKYALPNLLFGTCSLGLARLYATSQKAELIARDRVNRRNTYIFRAKKENSLIGFANIIKAKLLKRFAFVGLFTFLSKKSAAFPAMACTSSTELK